jgi:hypothetical protein
MKKIILITTLVCSVVFLFQGFSHAGQFFGALEPTARKGQFSIGAGYFFSNSDLEPKESDSFNKIKTQQNQLFIQAGYGFIKGGEVYLRGGLADAEKEKAFTNNSDFDDDFKPFGTLGVRLSNNLNPIFSVGTFLQGTLYSSYSDEIVYSLIKEKFETKNLPWEVNLGVGLQANLNSVLSYAGSMVYWERFDVKRKITSLSDSSFVEETAEYEEERNFGGFAGLRWSLGEVWHIEIEGQFKERISAGGSITLSF